MCYRNAASRDSFSSCTRNGRNCTTGMRGSPENIICIDGKPYYPIKGKKAGRPISYLCGAKRMAFVWDKIIAILEFLDKNQNIIRKWCLGRLKTIKLMKPELLMNKK